MSILQLPPLGNDPVTSSYAAKMDDRFLLIANLISTSTRQLHGTVDYRVFYVPVGRTHSRTKLIMLDQLVTWEICHNCIYLHLNVNGRVSPAIIYQFHIASMDDQNVHFVTDKFHDGISIAIMWNRLKDVMAIRALL